MTKHRVVAHTMQDRKIKTIQPCYVETLSYKSEPVILTYKNAQKYYLHGHQWIPSGLYNDEKHY